MMAGHFGLAAAAKSRAPDVPLWSLMLATVWLDVAFIPLFAAGVETLQPVPGTSGAYGGNVIHADYTHSLVGALVLSALLTVIASRLWGRRAATVVGAVAFSHWLLDLLVHRPDLPILPGNALDLPLLGLGLWRTPALSAVVELALVTAGALLYRRAAERVTGDDGRRSARPRTIAALMVTSGLMVLAAGFLGL
jgi:hypothetical protein